MPQTKEAFFLQELTRHSIELDNLKNTLQNLLLKNPTKDEVIEWKHQVRQFVSSYCYTTNQLEMYLLDLANQKTN